MGLHIIQRLVHVTVGAASFVMLLPGACNFEGAQEFREATRDEFETGVNALLDGVVQGVFEVYDPDEDGTTSDNETTTE